MTNFRAYVPLFRRVVELTQLDKKLSFGDAYKRALEELNITEPVPEEVQVAIITTAFRVVTRGLVLPLRAPADESCQVCGLPYVGSNETCACPRS